MIAWNGVMPHPLKQQQQQQQQQQLHHTLEHKIDFLSMKMLAFKLIIHKQFNILIPTFYSRECSTHNK